MTSTEPSDGSDFFSDFADVSAGLGTIPKLEDLYVDVSGTDPDSQQQLPGDLDPGGAVSPDLDRVLPDVVENIATESGVRSAETASAFTADPVDGLTVDEGKDFFHGVQPVDGSVVRDE